MGFMESIDTVLSTATRMVSQGPNSSVIFVAAVMDTTKVQRPSCICLSPNHLSDPSMKACCLSYLFIVDMRPALQRHPRVDKENVSR
jgi:hypothetical protein